MYKILTGICCGLWCLMIAYNAWGYLAVEQDIFDAAERFTEEMPSDVTVTLRLGGPCSKGPQAENAAEFLEEAACSLGIVKGYAILETETDGKSLWELSGADDSRKYSLKYLTDGQTKKAVSWTVTITRGEYKNYYRSLERLQEKYGIDSMVCMELSASFQECLESEQIEAMAEILMKNFGGSMVYGGQEDNLQIYYGYGENLGSYVRLSGSKANVNLIYRTSEKETRCLLGFPVVQYDD